MIESKGSYYVKDLMEELKKVMEEFKKVFGPSALTRFERAEEICNALLNYTTLYEEYTTLNEKYTTLYEEANKLDIELNDCKCKKQNAELKLEKVIKKNGVKALFSGKRISVVGGHQSDVKTFISAIKKKADTVNIKFSETHTGLSVPPYSTFKEKHLNSDAIIHVKGDIGHDLSTLVDKLRKEIGSGKVVCVKKLSLSTSELVFNELVNIFSNDKDFA